MKNLQPILILLTIIVFNSCSGDDPTVVKPITSFQQDRFFIEVGETVTFTNTSENGQTYFWDFGDNTTSNEENPDHVYEELGEFVVRLTVTSSTGERIATTSSVLVGNRWALAIRVDTINFMDSNGDPWDDDDTGPDLLIGFYEAINPNTNSFLNFGNDYVESDFPAGGRLPPEFQVMFTDQDWELIFLDNEPPLNMLQNSVVMDRFTFNPITIESEKDYELGGGVFEITANGFRFSLVFEIR
ncbi:PKD domain-containing protein [Roseivirga sp. E12]|uniref:PKD domain-containing protein n=1 Tax=Roseivirga sp. E12 TaxID=2819237 RepID=UPI001ABC1FD8|nr:PKD domain-containing protein [Roseivirga sp. E12]MBO3698631.1 PKD domain-containing protein [Roseivirga sp. E12]